MSKLASVANVNYNEYFENFDPDSYIPEIDPAFVPFGSYNLVHTIIERGSFIPTFIAGMSGNGKTASVVYACAKLRRPLIRIQMSGDTNEGDLIGKYELVDGDTVFAPGPVLLAMQLGAVLLIDEFTVAREDVVFAIQSVLEGNGVFVKKLNQKFNHKPGFTIIATANTKGQGLDKHGKYLANKVLDESTLDRFVAYFDWDYPPVDVELEILLNVAKKLAASGTGSKLPNNKCILTTCCEKLALWADKIRVAYREDTVSDMITTRRLIHILTLWDAYGDLETAVSASVSRFDESVKKAFLDYWNLLKSDSELVEQYYVHAAWPTTHPTTGEVDYHPVVKKRLVMVDNKTGEVTKIVEDNISIPPDEEYPDEVVESYKASMKKAA